MKCVASVFLRCIKCVDFVICWTLWVWSVLYNASYWPNRQGSSVTDNCLVETSNVVAFVHVQNLNYHK